MSNRILNNDMPSTAFGIAALALAFGVMSAHPQSVHESDRPITLAQAGSSTSGAGTQGTPSGRGTSGSSSTGGTNGTGTGSGTSGTGATTPSGGTAGSTGATGTTSGATGGTASNTTGTATTGSTAKLSTADRNMLNQFAAANLAEIEMAKLAESKSQNDQVKAYARRMIDDHTTALNELTQMARAKGADLPSKPDAQHQAALKKLSALSGADFDKQYLAQGGSADHRRVHNLLTRMSKDARDPDMKAMATKTLPTIDEHLKLAQAATSGTGTTTGSTSSGK